MKLAKIKALACAEGLDETGVAAVYPFSNLEAVLKKRLEEGKISPFEESNIALRTDPERLLPGAKSAIVFALPYRHRPQSSTGDIQGEAKHILGMEAEALPATRLILPYLGETGILSQGALSQEDSADQNSAAFATMSKATIKGTTAAVARGRDYHQVAAEKAARLIWRLKKEIGTDFKHLFLCDRSPLVERAIAFRAGLGLKGANCCLINQQYGSYVTLAVILTNLDLEKSEPSGKDCLLCGRCRQICPTEALTETGQLDYRRCLSFLTQAKGIFPKEYRSLLGSRIYGCDSCQDCCPLNEKARYSALPETAAELFPAKPDLLKLLDMTRKDFDQSIKLTSAGWRGKTTIQRNAVIALGNSKDQGAAKPLARLLENDRRALIRLHAAWALGEIGGAKATLALDKAKNRDPDETVRFEAAAALSRAGY